MNGSRLSLVTPSFEPDFERCSLLVESARLALDGSVEHHLIVPSQDLQLFGKLRGEGTEIHVQEDLLPNWIKPSDSADRRWTSSRSGDVGGWFVQQIVKLSAFRVVKTEGLLFLDSDNVFLRPVDLEQKFIQDGRLALRRSPGLTGNQLSWLQSAAEVLGLDAEKAVEANYVGNFVGWWRDVVNGLQRRLEAATGTEWQDAFLRFELKSEYALYGAYAENILGLDEARHFADKRMLVQHSWGHSIETSNDVREFLSHRPPLALTAMFHSRDHVPVELYAEPCQEILRRNLTRQRALALLDSIAARKSPRLKAILRYSYAAGRKLLALRDRG